jgi:hypothetical protein
MAAATSVVVGPFTVLVGGMSRRAGWAVTKPGAIGFTIVTLSTTAATSAAPAGISTVPPAHTGSPRRVSSRRRGAGSATNSPTASSGASSPVNQPVTSTITWPPFKL